MELKSEYAKDNRIKRGSRKHAVLIQTPPLTNQSINQPAKESSRSKRIQVDLL